MSGADREVSVILRDRYDRCTRAILDKDPDAFVAAFGPTARAGTAEGIPVTMAETRDYWAWRFGRTLEAQQFEVRFDDVQVDGDEVQLLFSEDSAATVLDAEDQPVRRTTFSVNQVVWRLEEGEWSQVAGRELEVRREIDGQPISPDQDPVGVPAYRRLRRR